MDPATAARAAARFGMALSVIGVGSPGEAPVTYVDPATGLKRSGIYRSDFNGAALEALVPDRRGQLLRRREQGGPRLGFRRSRGAQLLAHALEESHSRGALRLEVLVGLVRLLALARLLGLAGGGRQAVSFARPELLWLALLALPELALGIRRIPRFRASLERLAGPRRRVTRRARLFAAFSWLGSAAAALFITIAPPSPMAGPSWGARGSPAERRGLEAAIVLDVSRSMEATRRSSPSPPRGREGPHPFPACPRAAGGRCGDGESLLARRDQRRGDPPRLP